MHGAAAEIQSAGAGVAIHVHRRLRLQLGREILDPLGRSEQPLLLAVPADEQDAAPRPPALLHHVAHRARDRHHRDVAADRIRRAERPRVAMRADDDPFVRRHRAGNPADDVDQAALRVVHLQLHVDLRRPGTDVVGDRQRAAPRLRRDRPVQPLEQLDAVAIRHRLHRNRRERLDLVHRHPLDARLRRPAGRRRIAGIARHVHHAAALNHAPAAERTVGIHVALEVAVLVRIRVDEAGDRAVLGRDLRLDAAPAAAVAREHDLALHVDAELLRASRSRQGCRS